MKRHRTIDVISWVALSAIIFMQGYLFYKKFIGEQRFESTQSYQMPSMWTFTLSTLSVVLTVVIANLIIKIYQSKNMSIYGYHRDSDEFDFRKRKRKMLKILVVIQISILILLTVLKTWEQFFYFEIYWNKQKTWPKPGFLVRCLYCDLTFYNLTFYSASIALIFPAPTLSSIIFLATFSGTLS